MASMRRMRVERSVTALSWIPSEAVTGLVYRVPFEVGLAHYDDPPPERIDDVEGLLGRGRARFANVLRAWVDVEDGAITDYGHQGCGLLGSTILRLGSQGVTFAAVGLPDRQHAERLSETSVRFLQTAGGRTGVPAPRRVNHPPYVQLAAPTAWTTLSMVVHADGSVETSLAGASPFPRHWVYDGDGRLQQKSATVDYQKWSLEAFGQHTPWGDVDSPTFVTEAESALERVMSRQIMTAGQRPEIRRLDAGAVLTHQGETGRDLYVLLDGVLEVEVDATPLAQLGPGAVLGERALLEAGRRTSTLRAVTRCTVAVADRSAVDDEALQALAQGHHREEQVQSGAGPEER